MYYTHVGGVNRAQILRGKLSHKDLVGISVHVVYHFVSLHADYFESFRAYRLRRSDRDLYGQRVDFLTDHGRLETRRETDLDGREMHGGESIELQLTEIANFIMKSSRLED